MKINEPNTNSIQPQKEPVKGYRGPLRQIRELCKECAGGPKAARYCTGVGCPVWPYRFGKNPKRVIREEGKSSVSLFDAEWILQQAEKGSEGDKHE